MTKLSNLTATALSEGLPEPGKPQAFVVCDAPPLVLSDQFDNCLYPVKEGWIVHIEQSAEIEDWMLVRILDNNRVLNVSKDRFRGLIETGFLASLTDKSECINNCE